MILAEEFATSPAGYVSGLLVPILGALLLFLFQRKSSKDNQFRNEVREALNENSRALAVLVQRTDDATMTLLKVPSLEASVAVLKQRVDDHNDWAERNRREILDQVERNK